MCWFRRFFLQFDIFKNFSLSERILNLVFCHTFFSQFENELVPSWERGKWEKHWELVPSLTKNTASVLSLHIAKCWSMKFWQKMWKKQFFLYEKKVIPFGFIALLFIPMHIFPIWVKIIFLWYFANILVTKRFTEAKA